MPVLGEKKPPVNTETSIKPYQVGNEIKRPNFGNVLLYKIYIKSLKKISKDILECYY